MFFSSLIELTSRPLCCLVTERRHDGERDFGRGCGTRFTGAVEPAGSVRSVGHADNVGWNGESIVSQGARSPRFLSRSSSRSQAESAAHPRAVRSRRRRRSARVGLRVAGRFRTCHVAQIGTVLTRNAAVVIARQVGEHVTTRLRRVDRRRRRRVDQLAAAQERRLGHLDVRIQVVDGHGHRRSGLTASLASIVWSVGLGRR